MFTNVFKLSDHTQEQYYQLGCKNSKEHAQRVNSTVAYRRSVIGCCLISKSQSWRICGGSRNQTHQSKVIKLIMKTSYSPYNQNGQNCDYKTTPNVRQSITRHNGIYKSCPRFDSHTGKKKREAYLTQHQISTRSRIRHKFHLVTKTPNQYGNNQWATC